MKHWKYLAAAAACLLALAAPARAELDLSANMGFMSDYIYRGFHQSDGTANGGVDLANGPFYLGVWLADLDSDNGVEIDVYGGVAWEFEDGWSAYAGYTAYRYTEDDDGMMVDGECVGGGFDQDYDEINLGAGYAADDFSVSLDYAIGEHENGFACNPEDNDYDVGTLTLDYKGAYVTFGTYGLSEDDTAMGEPEGDWFELGYATTVNEFDLAVALVDSDEHIDDETRLTISVGYGFDL